MKKIVLFDPSIATLNIGDEIIKKSIEKNFPELNKSYIVNFPTHTPPYYRLQRICKQKMLRTISDADYKFFCGTNALYTSMLRPFPQWNVSIFNSALYKNTILLGVGAGINSKKVNFYTKKLYDRLLSHDYIHSVRDDYTADFLDKLGFRAVNTSCPTMWGLTPEHCTKIPIKKGKDVIFTLTSYDYDMENDKMMVEILRKNYERLYFWPQTVDDAEYLREIGDKDIQIVPANLASYDMMLNRDIDYVGNRLHGGIFALQHACRSIIIAIDYRAANMGQSFGLPVIERTDIGEKLDRMINTEWATNINGMNFENIKSWKSQFNFD